MATITKDYGINLICGFCKGQAVKKNLFLMR